MIEKFKKIETRLESIENLILEISKQPSHSEKESDKLFTIEQASEFLNLAKNTIYRYVQHATIPVSKKGKRLYFLKKELIQWVNEGRKKTISEIARETDQHLSQLKKA